MKTAASALLILIVVIGTITLFSSFYTVKETELAIVTEFGKPVGQPLLQPGLHFKTPFVQKVTKLEKRIMEWDGEPSEYQTKDKLFVNVDTFARWRIDKPLLFFQRLGTEEKAQSRIDDIIDGESRTTIASFSLIELIRTSNRQPKIDPTLASANVGTNPLGKIVVGREKLAREVFERTAKSLESMGIELKDIQFKRVNYSSGVQSKIYDRMISERKQIADKFRSEGAGKAAEIRGRKERELRRIESEAYKKTQTIRGEADAKATEIYAKAFNQGPQAYDFYQFVKTMETYRTTLDKSTMLILSTDGDFFKFLKGTGMSGQPAPLAPSAAATPQPAATKTTAPPAEATPAPAK